MDSEIKPGGIGGSGLGDLAGAFDELLRDSDSELVQGAGQHDSAVVTPDLPPAPAMPEASDKPASKGKSKRGKRAEMPDDPLKQVGSSKSTEEKFPGLPPTDTAAQSDGDDIPAEVPPAEPAETEDLSSLLTDRGYLAVEEQRKLIRHAKKLVADGNDDEAYKYIGRVLEDAPRGSAERIQVENEALNERSGIFMRWQRRRERQLETPPPPDMPAPIESSVTPVQVPDTMPLVSTVEPVLPPLPEPESIDLGTTMEELKAQKAAARAALPDSEPSTPKAEHAVPFSSRVTVAQGDAATAAKELHAWATTELKDVQQRQQYEEVSKIQSNGIEDEGLTRANIQLRWKDLEGEFAKLRELPTGAQESKRISQTLESLQQRVGELRQQEQFLLGRELAAEANVAYQSQLAEVLKGIEGSWWGGGEGKQLQAEMKELDEFFDNLGDYAQQLQALDTWKDFNGKFKGIIAGIADDAKLKKMEAQMAAAQSTCGAFESLDGLLNRTDFPPTLRAVIEAVQRGERYPFGEGPAANYRREVYGRILSTLGISAGAEMETPSPAEVKVSAEEAASASPESRSLEELGESTSTALTKMFEAIPIESMPRADSITKSAEQLAAAAQKETDPEMVAKQIGTIAGKSSPHAAGVALAMTQAAGSIYNSSLAPEDKQKQLQWLGKVNKSLGGIDALEMFCSPFGTFIDAVVAQVVTQTGATR